MTKRVIAKYSETEAKALIAAIRFTPADIDPYDTRARCATCQRLKPVGYGVTFSESGGLDQRREKRYRPGCGMRGHPVDVDRYHRCENYAQAEKFLTWQKGRVNAA